MSGKEDIRNFFFKLSEHTPPGPPEHKPGKPGLSPLPYIAHGMWPGNNYVLIGNSFNVEYRLVGTDKEHRRSGCIALMIEKLGDRNHCVALQDALEFEGFQEVLSRFEHDWLHRLPGQTLIGPAFDDKGECVRVAFSVWELTGSGKEKVLEIASRP